jgi:hypothetical protein
MRGMEGGKTIRERGGLEGCKTIRERGGLEI